MLRRLSMKKPLSTAKSGGMVVMPKAETGTVKAPLPLSLHPVTVTAGDELAAIVRVQSAFRKKLARAKVKRRSTFATAFKDSPLQDQIENVQQAQQALHDKLVLSCETNLPSLVDELSGFVHETSQLIATAQTSLALRIVLNGKQQRTTRSDYLLTLADRIGPRPEHDWKVEWEALIQENFHPKKPAGAGSLLRMVSLPGHSPLGAEGGRKLSLDIRTIMRDPSRVAQLVSNESSQLSPRTLQGPALARGDSVRLDVDGDSTRSRSDSDLMSHGDSMRIDLDGESTRSRRDTGQSHAATGEDDHSIEGWEAKPENSKQILARQKEGWPEADACAFELLASLRKPLAQALRADDPRFAASTYTICTALANAAVRQQASTRPVAPALYRNLYGVSGLVNDDPAWMRYSRSACSSAAPAALQLSSPLVQLPPSSSFVSTPPLFSPRALAASRRPTSTAFVG